MSAEHTMVEPISREQQKLETIAILKKEMEGPIEGQSLRDWLTIVSLSVNILSNNDSFMEETDPGLREQIAGLTEFIKLNIPEIGDDISEKTIIAIKDLIKKVIN